jgi:hypothetical protein
VGHQFVEDGFAAHQRAGGKGEIESTHRYIVQLRLKLPGAGANAKSMLALCLNRANGH